MRPVLLLLEKEFRQIWRNPILIRMLLMLPLIQLIIFPLAADYEIKNLKIAVVDNDRSTYSALLIGKLQASNYFRVGHFSNSYKHALVALEKDHVDLIIQIPSRFEKDIVRENEGVLFLAINAVNGVKGGLGGAYLTRVINDFNREIILKGAPMARIQPTPSITVEPINWFNPLLNYKYFMVPGILVLLLTLVGVVFSSQNIVREKEIGTIEQINVSPLFKWQFIAGKLIPFWIVGLVLLTLSFAIIRLIYGIQIEGTFFSIYIFSAVYLLAVLGLGLLVSTLADTQQQALLISFFMMMLMVLLGGLFTSIDSMPFWAKVVTWFNPMAYFIDVMRMVVLKGSGLRDISFHFLVITLFAIVFNTLAVWNFKKRS